MESTMQANRSGTAELHDVKVNVKLRMAGLWASLMFVFLYVDVIGFYEPGVIEDALAGKVWDFDITQTWAVAALALMTLPSLMVYLSVALPARVNRRVNLVVAGLYVIIATGNAIGESWVVFVSFAAIVEVVLLALILRNAWNWPKAET
jgi:hypothetical protein